MINASCFCKATTYTIDGDLHSSRYCHCENCRKVSGTTPVAWAMTGTLNMKVNTTNAGITKFNSGRGIRCFCSNCGSSLWFESVEHPEMVAIPLGVLDSGDIPYPEMHIWTQSKPAWRQVYDDLPEHETCPE